MTEKLFETALGIAAPWYVAGADSFDIPGDVSLLGALGAAGLTFGIAVR
jgi:hypothetical protein